MAEKVYYTLNGERLEATGDLRDQILADKQMMLDLEAERAAEAQAKADARASAIAKLEALGLTVDEVSAAFGLEA